jgi:hypothetical protein
MDTDNLVTGFHGAGRSHGRVNASTHCSKNLHRLVNPAFLAPS